MATRTGVLNHRERAKWANRNNGVRVRFLTREDAEAASLRLPKEPVRQTTDPKTLIQRLIRILTGAMNKHVSDARDAIVRDCGDRHARSVHKDIKKAKKRIRSEWMSLINAAQLDLEYLETQERILNEYN